MESPITVRVAAGILLDENLRVLVAERSESVHGPGYWEFPGGKIESGETPQGALTRELDEELGIRVQSAMPAMSTDHTYKQRTVELHFFLVTEWDREPRGAEGQALQWSSIEDLAGINLLPANRGVVDWLREKYLADT